MILVVYKFLDFIFFNNTKRIVRRAPDMQRPVIPVVRHMHTSHSQRPPPLFCQGDSN